MTRTCCVCGAVVTRDRFRSPLERTTCNLPAPCRNRLIARTRAAESWEWMRGPNSRFWTGGTMRSQGYVYVLQPGHHRANKQGYTKRADLVLEATLGRLLQPDEIAHHKNDVRDDDSPDNLEPMERGPHMRLHTAKRKAQGRYIGAHRNQPRLHGRFTKS